MKKKDPIQVFEYETLYHEGHPKGRISYEQFNALIKYNQEHDHRFFNIVHKGIKFKQYVGVIQVGNQTIEILPKADKPSTPTEDTAEEKTRWHNILFQLLRACKHLKVEASTAAHLQLRKASLLDLYIHQFLEEVARLVQRGLVKQYRTTSSNQNVLTGRLEFQQHLSKNLIHKERFYVRHQVYDQVHLLHQILNEALELIPSISNNPNFMDSIGRLQLDFPNLPPLKIHEQTFSRITFNRKTEHYRPALAIARLLLLNYSPDIKGGQNNLLGILFDMNELFEDYVYQQLRKAAPAGIQVRRQVSKRFWDYKLIRPDIVIQTPDKTIVLDTKWKVLREVKPSDADLKQMYAYHHYLNADETYLLYPRVHAVSAKSGGFHQPKERQFTCHLAFVDVLDGEGGLNRALGMEVLAMVKNG